MSARSTWLRWLPVAIVLPAIALWPYSLTHTMTRASALPTPAPIVADYQQRDTLIAFWERAAGEHHRGDMISPGRLAEQYLQRYRERGDIDDVLRAEHAAKTSLRIQPIGNLAAEIQLASVYLTLHRFHDALTITKSVEAWDPADDGMLVREASLDMEIGAYSAAHQCLSKVKSVNRDDAWRVANARYLELTGKLADAKRLLATVSAYQNAVFDKPAQQRAWYFFRQGEMAFEAGENNAAIADEREAIAIFPYYTDAYRTLARIECSVQDWRSCLQDAATSAQQIPYPETLGYEADAQRALGDREKAAQTDDLIRTIESIGNTQHISDRLLAIYYSEHHLYPSDAYAIAKRELQARDDIFTEDTLAWAAAMDGRWNEAQSAIHKALRLNTENALLHYHAGIIALHFGNHEEGKFHLKEALALNPHFHPFYADAARSQLEQI